MPSQLAVLVGFIIHRQIFGSMLYSVVFRKLNTSSASPRILLASRFDALSEIDPRSMCVCARARVKYDICGYGHFSRERSGSIAMRAFAIFPEAKAAEALVKISRTASKEMP